MKSNLDDLDLTSLAEKFDQKKLQDSGLLSDDHDDAHDDAHGDAHDDAVLILP